jgi:magnesium-transporting ATPase (P-type)
VLVMGGFWWVLRGGGWTLGKDIGAGSPLHDTWARATTMTFAGIVVCQIGTAMAARTERVSLFTIGVLSNRRLLLGIAFEIAISAAAVYLPWAHDVLGTRSLDLKELAVLTTFPPIVWGADEAYRLIRRHHREA